MNRSMLLVVYDGLWAPTDGKHVHRQWRIYKGGGHGAMPPPTPARTIKIFKHAIQVFLTRIWEVNCTALSQKQRFLTYLMVLCDPYDNVIWSHSLLGHSRSPVGRPVGSTPHAAHIAVICCRPLRQGLVITAATQVGDEDGGKLCLLHVLS